MQNRFTTALVIQNACNPRGVANELVRMLATIADEGKDTEAQCNDPAVKLVVAKLADLCGLEYVWPREAAEACEAHDRVVCEPTITSIAYR